MKKLFYATALISTLMLSQAKADKLPAPTIAVVEQALLDKSKASESIIQQMEAKRAEIQKELASLENTLKKEEGKLIEDQKKLSEKDFEKKRKEFEKRVQNVQEKVSIRRAQMEIAFEDAKKKVYEAFLKIANETMKESGANLILYKETIVTANSSFDLSSEVLKRLNKTLPTVKVTFKPESEIKNLLLKQAKQS